MDAQRDLITRITEQLDDARQLHDRLAALAPAVAKITAAAVKALSGNGKIITFGNGGSAADAQHIAAELLGHFRLEREAWPVIALTTNSSALTAIGNDYRFEEVFARQIVAWARPGDVVIGITTSGKSKNVLRGLEQAKHQGAVTVGFCGSATDAIRSRCDVLLDVPSIDTPRVQEAHILLGHIFCQEVERLLVSRSRSAGQR